MLFLLVNEGPQFVQLTLVEMEVTKEVTHHPLAVSTQQQEPATQRILVYGEQSPSRTQRQAFCKRRCRIAIGQFIGANASIGCAGASRNPLSTNETA